jgi:hypothetical protein
MVRFAVEKEPVVVHDITEATDEEIEAILGGDILRRAFGESA